MRPRRLPLLGVALLASMAMAIRRSVPIAPDGSAPCNLSGWWDHDTRVVQHGVRVASSANYGTGEGTFNATRLELVMNFSNQLPSAGPLHGAVSTDCDTVTWSTGIWRRQPKPPPLRVFPNCTTGPPYQPGVAELPADCPLDISPGASLRFTGEHCNHDPSVIHADTWYPSELRPGVLFSSWTDSHVGEVTGGGGTGNPGWAVINGSTPPTWTIDQSARGLVKPATLGTVDAPVAPLGGRYPCAAWAQDGELFYGTYGLDNGPNIPQYGYDICARPDDPHDGGTAWCIISPFIGFHTSTDSGATWGGAPDLKLDARNNLFGQRWPEPPRPFQFKITQPHFVDFGPNNPSPDGRAYLVSHGCDPDSPLRLNCSWSQGSQLYLFRSRSRLTAAIANDPRTYEFYTGGTPLWADTVAEAKSVISWHNRIGTVSISWSSHLQRFLLFSRTPTGTTNDASGYLQDMMVCESPQLQGPWRVVTYMRQFGPEGDWPVVKASWIQPINATAVRAWLLYSQCWTGALANPPYCAGDGCYGLVAAVIEINIPDSDSSSAHA